MVICGEVLSQQEGSVGGGMGNLGSLLAGVDECKTGTVLSIISLLQSRIRTVTGICADVVPRTGRSLALGLMAICLAVGNTIGSVLGAYLARNAGDLTVVLRFALILTALLSVYLSVIPESLRKPSTADAHPNDSGNEIEQEVDGEELSRPGRTETSRSWTIKSIFVFVKECLAMITDPIALFLPEHIPKSKNIATSAVPMLVLLVNFLSVMGHRGRAIVLNHDDSEEMDVSLSLEPRGIFSAVDSIKMDVFFSLVQR
ncbi:hypothetical protein BGZ91_007270 [Linnemannia elongata]|nr:hypothetical protein BGZ91_007270 [Linnemannia elongata]